MKKPEKVVPKEHKSIISNDPKCFHCGSEVGLDRHHIFMGIAYRYKAEEDGCWIYLCRSCHTFLHEKGRELDLQYKGMAQKAWMKHYNKGIKEFRQRYGKSFL